MVITSIEDDQFGGDTLGDGPVENPARTDGIAVWADSSEAVQIHHALFRYLSETLMLYDTAPLYAAHCGFFKNSSAVSQIAEDASSTLQDCNFYASVGASADVRNGDAVFTGCRFSAPKTTCLLNYSNLQIQDCFFELDGQAAILEQSNSLTIVQDCTFQGQGTGLIGGRGDTARMQIDRCLFSDLRNGVYYGEGTLSITNSVFSQVTQDAVKINCATTSITNNIFAYCSHDGGSAISIQCNQSFEHPPLIQYNDFYGNANHAVYNTNAYLRSTPLTIIGATRAARPSIRKIPWATRSESTLITHRSSRRPPVGLRFHRDY